ncbi:restriction endonuclease subunit S [Enterobacter hormaechei]
MAKYKAYPEYKDSGVEWLGKVPTHWQLIPCRAVVSHIVDKNDNGKIKNYLSLMANVGVIRYEDKGDIGNKKPDDLTKCKIVKKGQLVINSMNYGIGSYGMSPFDGVCSSVYIILEPKENILKRYALRIFENTPFQKHLATFGNGILEHRAAIKWDDIKGQAIPLPCKDEQRNILKFLDHQTARIDDLIEKQQQLIELLKEKRQAVISHAVTKGLIPDVPMKDSGVEWLGKVPDHWKLIKFSHCVSIRSGQVDPRKLPYCDYWLIAPNHIVSGEGRIINLETAKDQGADSGKYLCRTGEVIYSKIRPALVKACLSPSDKVLCSADMYPMSSYNGLTNNFLLLYLLSDAFTRFAVNQADRVAMPKINRESLSDCKIPVPPIEEQEKIYSHVREALEKLDVLLQKSQLTIEFFQERRTALISAAVTGKIDVRGWVAPDTQDIEASQEATA